MPRSAVAGANPPVPRGPSARRTSPDDATAQLVYHRSRLLAAMRRATFYAELVGLRSAGGVLLTGVYGSGKSSVAAEISYLLERRRQPHALLDLDYLGWGGGNFDDHAAGFGLMLRNLVAVASNYRDAGISVFVVVYFVRNHDALRAVREATGVPLRVVRLSVPMPVIERRLSADMTSGRADDLREAALSIASGEGVGVEDVTVINDQPIGVVAHEVMTWLGWL